MKMICASLKNLWECVSGQRSMRTSKLKEWMQDMGVEAVKIAGVEFKLNFSDRKAAWDLYVELATRVSTQELEDGDDKSALNSIYSLFGVTRKIVKDHGMRCARFSQIAFVVLNSKIRPFTSKWHKVSLQEGFENKTVCEKFRKELSVLRKDLLVYTKMLADLAGVDDFTQLEMSHANREPQHA